jgi:hypothetical protein
MNPLTKPSFLLYGANGYTARLIIDLANSFGLTPVLAGRNEASVKSLADQYGLTYRIAALNDALTLNALLVDVSVVLPALDLSPKQLRRCSRPVCAPVRTTSISPVKLGCSSMA